MRLLKYLFPFWVVIFVYSLLSLARGSSGFSAYDELKAERDKQLANIESLKRISRELEEDRDALLYDKDAIALHARELGYGAEHERLVRIAGLSKTPRPQYWAGEIAEVRTPPSMNEKTIRTISLVAGGLVFGFILFVELLKMTV
jgi:cell division protein FtsB